MNWFLKFDNKIWECFSLHTILSLPIFLSFRFMSILFGLAFLKGCISLNKMIRVEIDSVEFICFNVR